MLEQGKTRYIEQWRPFGHLGNIAGLLIHPGVERETMIGSQK